MFLVFYLKVAEAWKNLVPLQSQNRSYGLTDGALALLQAYVCVYPLPCLENKMALVVLARPIYKPNKSALHTQESLCGSFWIAGIRSRWTVGGPGSLSELFHLANETPAMYLLAKPWQVFNRKLWNFVGFVAKVKTDLFLQSQNP